MLAECLELLIDRVATNNRDKIRVFKTPESVPGVINIATMKEDGTYETETVDYLLQPVKYVTKTLGAFIVTLKRLMTDDDDGVTADIFVGTDYIIAYLDGDLDLHLREQVILKLEPTPAWEFVNRRHNSSAIALKYTIKELFTGYPDGASPILGLIPLLSKVSVNESKKTVADNSKAMNSIGLDVQQSLNLNDSDIPEEVMCPVSVYKQHDYIHYVKMLFRFDFEQSKFILSPVQHDLDEALDVTVGEIMETIASPASGLKSFQIYPANAIIPTGGAELK